MALRGREDDRRVEDEDEDRASRESGRELRASRLRASSSPAARRRRPSSHGPLATYRIEIVAIEAER